jgi:hypothetical protein
MDMHQAWFLVPLGTDPGGIKISMLKGISGGRRSLPPDQLQKL